MRFCKFFLRLLSFTAAGAAGTFLLFHGAIHFLLEEYLPAKVKVIRITEKREDLPAELSGMKIAFFADLHWKFGNDKRSLYRDLVERVKAESPDLILIGGDVADQFLKKIPAEEIGTSLIPYLKKFSAPMGVYAVMGNHEAACGREDYRKIFREAGIRSLEGERVYIPGSKNPHSGVELTGIMEVRWDNKTIPLPEDWEEEASLPEEPEKKNFYPLYLCHRPEVFSRLIQEEKRSFLLLAAHYHGGLFFIPFLKKGHIINQRKKRPIAPYVYGSYREKDSFLYVTSGISGGYFFSRSRVNLPRELLILTLEKGKK